MQRMSEISQNGLQRAFKHVQSSLHNSQFLSKSTKETASERVHLEVCYADFDQSGKKEQFENDNLRIKTGSSLREFLGCLNASVNCQQATANL